MYFCWGGVFYDQRNMCYFFLGKNVRAKVKDSGNSKLGSVSEYRLLHMILQSLDGFMRGWFTTF